MPLFAFFYERRNFHACRNKLSTTIYHIVSFAALKSDENELHGLEDVFSKFIDLLEVEHSRYENTRLKDEINQLNLKLKKKIKEISQKIKKINVTKFTKFK